MIADPEKIEKIIDSMDQEAKQIKSNVLKMCWYMRGGVTYDEAMHMSIQERELINDIIKENIDTTKKSGLPFF